LMTCRHCERPVKSYKRQADSQNLLFIFKVTEGEAVKRQTVCVTS
jgi:hypothetical protein